MSIKNCGTKKAATHIILFILSVSLTVAFFASIDFLADLRKNVIDTDVTTPNIEQTTTTVTEEVITTEPSVCIEVEKINTPILFLDAVYAPAYNIAKDTEVIMQLSGYIIELQAAIDSGDYSDTAITLMHDEISRLRSISDKLTCDIDTYKIWLSEYQYAANTWLFLKQHGFSDKVAAAIIGNMMIECGGGTLKLKPEIYSADGGFYGLCQWSLYYKPFMSGKSFEDQLTYLVDDLPKEFKNFGFCYTKGYTYNHFLASEDPAQAALAFAKVYERCAASSYNMRKLAAVKAYQYFVFDRSNSF